MGTGAADRERVTVSMDDDFEPGPAVASGLVALAAAAAIALAVALSGSAPVAEAAARLSGPSRAASSVSGYLAAREAFAATNQNAFDALLRRADVVADAARLDDTVEIALSERFSRSAQLQTGDVLAALLAREGVRRSDAAYAAASLRGVYDARKLRAGQEIALDLATAPRTVAEAAAGGEAPPYRLDRIAFRPEPEKEVVVERAATGRFEARVGDVVLERRVAAVSGEISGSLYESAVDAGVHPQALHALADVFAYSVDFQRDIRPGDAFEAVFEEIVDDRGEIVGAGDLLFARLTWTGGRREQGYYAFETPDGVADFFDADGETARRLLMKTPIDGARVSSGFGVRRHPISGYTKKHKGVDFAARSGTPIKAAGDGVVVRADRFGSFGNYVRIRHANGYETAYAHLKGFSKAARQGARVRQGDVIGYVGSTGRSTGPHLHYEVHQNGRQVNPMTIRVAHGRTLVGAELTAFMTRREEIDAFRSLAPAPLAAAMIGDQL